ncbi:hypothetical protein JMJ35_004657 [Cladonia borealis]|uniref:Uncharacterized protein n=1 Tax=Cladonia borealis TaxID=184061 RepID=A0AA39V8G2_9LECA|nr:hypothetical protein JMJ35_004657 [Cladonia borealis]
MRAFSCTHSFFLFVLSFITIRHSLSLSIDSQAAAILEPRLDGDAITTGTGTWNNSTFKVPSMLATSSSSNTVTGSLKSPTTTEYSSIYLIETLSGSPGVNATTASSPVIDSQPSTALSSAAPSSAALSLAALSSAPLSLVATSLAATSSKRNKCKPSTGIINVPSQSAVQPSVASALDQAPNMMAASTPAAPSVGTGAPATNEDVALAPMGGSVSSQPAAASVAAGSGQTGNENAVSGSPAAGSAAPAACGPQATVTVTMQNTVTVTVTAGTADSSPVNSAVAAPVAVNGGAAPVAAGAANSASISNVVAAPAPITNNGETALAAVTSGAAAAPAAITSSAMASKSYKTTCKHRTKRRTSNAATPTTSPFTQNVEATAAASASASASVGDLSGNETPMNFIEDAATLASLPGIASQEAATQTSSPGWQSSGGMASSSATQGPLSSSSPMAASTQGSSSLGNATWSSMAAWQTSIGLCLAILCRDGLVALHYYFFEQ